MECKSDPDCVEIECGVQTPKLTRFLGDNEATRPVFHRIKDLVKHYSLGEIEPPEPALDSRAVFWLFRDGSEPEIGLVGRFLGSRVPAAGWPQVPWTRRTM